MIVGKSVLNHLMESRVQLKFLRALAGVMDGYSNAKGA
jgi:hypothetical protein